MKVRNLTGGQTSYPEKQKIVWDESIYDIESSSRGELVLKRRNKLNFNKLYDGAKVVCVNNTYDDRTLEIGKVYIVNTEEHLDGSISYVIRDEGFSGVWYINERTEHLFKNY